MLLILLALLLGLPLLCGSLPPSLDEAWRDEVRFLGFYRIVSAWWAEGSFPLWNSSFGYGIPLAGDIRSFAFLPFSWTAAFMTTEHSFSLLFALGFPWAAAGMFLFLRAMRLSRTASFLGGWLFGCTGWSWISFYIGHLDFIYCYGSIPWVLAGLRNAFEAQKSERLLLSVPGWVMIVSVGRPEVMLVAAYLTCLCAFAWSRPRDGLMTAAKRTSTALAVIGIFTFLVAFLPFASILEFVLQCGRYTLGSHAEALKEMQRVQRIIPRTLLQLLLPRSLGDLPGPAFWGTPLISACVWIGTIPLFLQLMLSVRHRTWRDDGLWAALSLFGILVAFNDRLPFLDLARRFIPGLSFVSAPPRFLFLVHMAVAIFSATAIDRIRRAPNTARARGVSKAGFALCAVALCTMVILPSGSPEADQSLANVTGLAFISWRGVGFALREFAIAGVILLAAGMLVSRCRSPRHFASWIVVLAILESVWFMAPYWKFSTLADYDRHAGIGDPLRSIAKGENQSWVGAPYHGAWPTFYYGASTLDGWHPFTPTEVSIIGQEFASHPERPAFRLLGVDHLLRETGPSSAWLNSGSVADSLSLWTRPSRLGRVYLASRTMPPKESIEESLTLLDGLSDPPGALAGAQPWHASDTGDGAIVIKSWKRSRIVLEVHAPSPRFLVFGEKPTARRRFFVNETEVASEPANIIASGISIPGDCEVVIDYRIPRWLILIGIAGPLSACAAALVFIRAGWFKRMDEALGWQR